MFDKYKRCLKHDKENHVVTLTMQKLYIKPFLSKLKDLVSIFSSMVLFYCANVNTTFRKWQNFFLETPFPFMWQKKMSPMKMNWKVWQAHAILVSDFGTPTWQFRKCFLILLYTTRTQVLRQIETYTYICHISIRGVGAGWAGRALAHPVFDGLKVYKIT